jgi:hypothetical protein
LLEGSKPQIIKIWTTEEDNIDNDYVIGNTFAICENADYFSDFFNSNQNNNNNSLNRFSVLHQNIRSYNRNFDEFLVYIQTLNYHFNCFVLTECWLGRNDSELDSIPGYKCYHSSQNLNQNDGVVVYLDNKITASCVQLCLGGIATALSLTFDWDGSPCEILAVYRSPSSSLPAFIDGISEYFYSRRDFHGNAILIGDTNCDILSPSHNSLEERYLDVISEAGFISCINTVTRPDSNTCIDHCFIKLKNGLKTISAVIYSNITDHYSIAVQFSKLGKRGNQSETAHSFKKTNWLEVSQHLSAIDWSEVLNSSDVNLCTDIITDKIGRVISQATTELKHNSRNSKIKPWITTGLILSIRRRDKLYKKMKNEPFNPRIRNKFIEYRNILHNLIKRSKFNYYRSKINEAAGNPRKFWNVVNEVAGRPRAKERFPVEAFCDGGGPASPSRIKHIGNEFNTYFSTVGSQLANNITPRGAPEAIDATRATDSVFALEPIDDSQLRLSIA